MQQNRIFSINFSKLAVMILPTMLRTKVIMAFVRAATAGTSAIFVAFKHYRQQVDFRLRHNGQRCYLRRALNELYDPVERRIRIGEGVQREVFVVWHREEFRQLFVPYREQVVSELVPWRNFKANGIDFTVLLPQDIHEREYRVAKIKATTNTFKLASKTFEIALIKS